MEQATDPTERALRLLSLLTGRVHWSGAELAERLGVTTRTLRRDVGRLRRLGYRVDATAGIDGGYRLGPADAAAVPPLFLDADEAIAIVSALLVAAAAQSTTMADATLSALAKLPRVLPAGVQAAADAVRQSARAASLKAAPAVAPATIAALAEACRDRVAIRFDYRSRGGADSQRRVEPHALVTVSGAWYLVAFDVGRDDWRSFRIDRIVGAVERTGHGTARRTIPGGDPLAYLSSSIAGAPFEFHAELVVAVDLAKLRLLLPRLDLARVDDRGMTCRIRLGATSVGELTRQIVDVLGAADVATLDTDSTTAAHLDLLAARLAAARGRAQRQA